MSWWALLHASVNQSLSPYICLDFNTAASATLLYNTIVERGSDLNLEYTNSE